MDSKKKTETPGVKITPIEKVDEAPLDLSITPLAKLVTYYSKENAKLWKEERLDSLVNSIANEGENQLRQVARVEVKAFDSSFLDALQVGLEAVGKILANPRTFIKETTELENVEKAKKVSVVSIQHFATHSQYLRTVEANGNVIPDKILTIHSETNTAIYENRFVMTLIKRCLSFIEQRYNFVVEHGETLDSDELFVHSVTKLGGVDYNVTMRIKASVPSEDGGNSDKNNELLRRLSDYKQRCSDYLRSSFMTQMKGAKDVSSPVHMTNMLLKHPDYHAAYVLWEFIEQYESLGVSYDVQETSTKFDKAYLRSIHQMLADAVLTLHTRHQGIAEVAETKAKNLEPVVLFTLDDLSYDDGRFVYDAYPEAENHRSPFDVLSLEQRAEKLEKKVVHLTVQEKAAGVAKKKIQRAKDQKAYAEAQGRRKQQVLVEQEQAEAKKKRKEAEEKARKREEEKRKRAKERARKKEEAAYLKEKQKLEGK